MTRITENQPTRFRTKMDNPRPRLLANLHPHHERHPNYSNGNLRRQGLPDSWSRPTPRNRSNPLKRSYDQLKNCSLERNTPSELASISCSKPEGTLSDSAVPSNRRPAYQQLRQTNKTRHLCYKLSDQFGTSVFGPYFDLSKKR